jgi:hypothetical protein
LRIGSACGGAQAALIAWINWLRSEDGDHLPEIVGENVKAHFRSHLFERAGARPKIESRLATERNGNRHPSDGHAKSAARAGRKLQFSNKLPAFALHAFC